MTRILKAFALALPVVFALALTSYADETTFRTPVTEAVSFFKPVIGNVAGVAQEKLTVDAGETEGVKVGMRFRVLRVGEPFIHPITGQSVGRTETQVGMAEVIGVGPDWSRMKLLFGTAQAGDVARISSSPVRALFYQASRVDWDLSEEYYFWLKENGRFEIIDAQPGKLSDAEVAEQAKAQGAEIAIVLGVATDAEGIGHLRQKVYWAMDGVLVSATDIRVSEEEVVDLKRNASLLTVEPPTEVYAIVIPEEVKLMAPLDVDGDGIKELALAYSSEVKLHETGPVLKAPFGLDAAPVAKFGRGETPVWMDSIDIDADGNDELLLSTVRDNRAFSYVYKFNPSSKGFDELWKKPGFARVIDGKLWGQKANLLGGGFDGPVYMIANTGEPIVDGEIQPLPKGVNLYDFTWLPLKGGSRLLFVFRVSGDAEVLDASGVSLWKSPDTMGGSARRFEMTDFSAEPGTRYWQVSDRVIRYGGTLFTVKRTRVSNVAKGLGFKGSTVISLVGAPIPVITPVIDGIPDKAWDFGIVGDQIMVLTDTLDLNIANIFRGKKIFGTKLLVYRFGS